MNTKMEEKKAALKIQVILAKTDHWKWFKNWWISDKVIGSQCVLMHMGLKNCCCWPLSQMVNIGVRTGSFNSAGCSLLNNDFFYIMWMFRATFSQISEEIWRRSGENSVHLGKLDFALTYQNIRCFQTRKIYTLF